MPLALTTFALTPLARLAVVGMARFWDDVHELEARRAILQRPWDHEALHWSAESSRIVLHGRTLPRHGAVLTTARGWCPCLTRTRIGGDSGEPTSTDQ